MTSAHVCCRRGAAGTNVPGGRLPRPTHRSPPDFRLGLIFLRITPTLLSPAYPPLPLPYPPPSAATDTKTDKMVAIKKIENVFEHATFTKRTLRELKILRLMNHENVRGVGHIPQDPTLYIGRRMAVRCASGGDGVDGWMMSRARATSPAYLIQGVRASNWTGQVVLILLPPSFDVTLPLLTFLGLPFRTQPPHTPPPLSHSTAGHPPFVHPPPYQRPFLPPCVSGVSSVGVCLLSLFWGKEGRRRRRRVIDHTLGEKKSLPRRGEPLSAAPPHRAQVYAQTYRARLPYTPSFSPLNIPFVTFCVFTSLHVSSRLYSSVSVFLCLLVRVGLT